MIEVGTTLRDLELTRGYGNEILVTVTKVTKLGNFIVQPEDTKYSHHYPHAFYMEEEGVTWERYASRT